MTDITPTLFDYGALDAESRIVVQQKTGEIRERIGKAAQNIVEIGERLIVVQERLESQGEATFDEWLDLEFAWSRRTAYRMMAVARRFAGANLALANMAPSAIYLLASDSVTDEQRQEFVQRAEAGEKVTHKEVADAVKPKPKCKKCNAVITDPASGSDHCQWCRGKASLSAASGKGPKPKPDKAHYCAECGAVLVGLAGDLCPRCKQTPDAPEQLYECDVCQEKFTDPVWHCPNCGSHYHDQDDHCSNCYREKEVGENTATPVEPEPDPTPAPPRVKNRMNREEGVKPIDDYDEQFATAFRALMLAVKQSKQQKWANIPQNVARTYCEQILAFIDL